MYTIILFYTFVFFFMLITCVLLGKDRNTGEGHFKMRDDTTLGEYTKD